MGKNVDVQGHVTLKQIVWSGQKSNSSKILCRPGYLQVCLEEDPIKTEGAIMSTTFFLATLKGM